MNLFQVQTMNLKCSNEGKPVCEFLYIAILWWKVPEWLYFVILFVEYERQRTNFLLTFYLNDFLLPRSGIMAVGSDI